MNRSIRIAALALAVVALLNIPAEAWHRSRYRRCCACQCAAASSNCHQPTTTNVASKPKIKLELATVDKPTRDRIIVRISATNQGNSAVTWDNEFAVLMEWSVWIGTDFDYRATVNGESIPQSSQPLTSTRFVTLCPGQSIARDVDLTKGIKVFATGHATMIDGGHAPIAYEAILKYWIPEKSKTISISTRYSDSDPDPFGGDTFRLYFGKTQHEVGLPDGWFASNRLVIHIAD